MPTAYLASRSGNTDFVLSSVESTYSETTGWTNVYAYRGPVDGLNAALGALVSGYSKLTIVEDGAMRELTVVYGGGSSYDPDGTATTPADPISRVWTLQGNTLQKPLVEADFLRLAYVDPANPELTTRRLSAAVSVVKDAIALYKKAASEETTAGTADPATYRDMLVDDGYQRELFDRLVIDDDVFEMSQFVLQCVEEVTSATSIVNGYDFIDRLLTTATLKAVEPTLDAATLVGVDRIESDYGPVYWKKQAPTLNSTFGGKVELSRSYWGYRSFDSWRYGAAL